MCNNHAYCRCCCTLMSCAGHYSDNDADDNKVLASFLGRAVLSLITMLQSNMPLSKLSD